MARYHELGRFIQVDASNNAGDKLAAINHNQNTDNSDLANMDMGDGTTKSTAPIDYDRQSAWFHLDMAARCHVLEAVLTVAKIHLGLSHDLLKDFEVDVSASCSIAQLQSTDDDNLERGLDMMQEAAVDMGDRGAMLHLAEAYDTGRGLCESRRRSHVEAVRFYEMAIEAGSLAPAVDCASCDGATENRSGNYDCTANTHPMHVILARLAELYQRGEFSLAADAQKAGMLNVLNLL